MLTERDIQTYFAGVKRRNRPNSWQAKCPCHDDKQASLTITNDTRTGKTLLRCHAGCSTKDILDRVGLTFSDLNDKPITKVNKPAWQNNLEAEYRYYDYENGNKYAYSKLRYKGKRIVYARVNGDIYEKDKGDSRPLLYNGRALIKTDNRPVYYCEGEKDCDTLTKNFGVIAVTAGSVSDWRKDFAPLFKGRSVTILADNDKPGQDLAERVQRDILGYAYKVRIITPSAQPKGDITDYLDINANKQAAFEAIKNEGTHPYQYAWWCDDKGKVNADTLANTFTQHNKVIVAKYQARNIDIPFIYRAGVYKATSKTEIMSELRKYIPVGVCSANTLKGAAELVLASVDRVEFDEFNRNENIINLKNGLYDIKTHTLGPHDPDVLSTIQLNLEYAEGADCPKWTKFISDFCSDEEGELDEEMRQFLQEITGLILSNVYGYRVKSCLILYSSEGNTGKSVFLNILVRLLGLENVANVSFQRMSKDRFATADLYGKRLDSVPDQSSTDLTESSEFKQLTGGEPNISAQFKGLQSFTFEFRGVIAIACNILPAFQDDKGNHLISRLGIIHCRNVIKPEAQNKNLVFELTKEASGIFNWAMQGLRRLRSNGLRLTACTSGDKLKDEYRKRIDNLYDFITDEAECIRGEGLKVLKTDFEQSYERYCDKNSYTRINKKNIAPRLEGYGIIIKKYDGYPYYCGIDLFENVCRQAGFVPNN